MRPNRMRVGDIIGASIFLSVFMAGFAAWGVVGIIRGAQRPDRALIIFGAVFILLGIGIAFLIGEMIRSWLQQRALTLAHPNEPWMWNPDWASGIIPDHATGIALGSWFLAGLWNAIAWPSAVMAGRQYLHKPDPFILIAAIFPAVGLSLAVKSLNLTRQVVQYGKSTLQLQTFPGMLGGELSGAIRAARQLPTWGPVRLHLACYRRRHQNRRKSNPVEVPVWEDHQDVNRTDTVGQGSVIPFRFAIPADQPPSSPYQDGYINWRLEASASEIGVDYRARFEVPVFRNPNAPIDTGVPAPVVPRANPAAQPKPGDQVGIACTSVADGGCTITVSSFRYPKSFLVPGVLGIGFTVAAVCTTRNASSFLPIVVLWILAAILDLVALGALVDLLSSATITAGSIGLHVVRGLPLMKIRRDLPLQSIKDIQVTETSESTVGNTSTTWYALYAVVAGKSQRLRIVRGIRGYAEAENLANQLKHSLRLTNAEQPAYAAQQRG